MLNIYERESETLKIMTSWAVLSAPPAPEPPFSYYSRLTSFEINFISKEISRVEPEYMNIHPPISALATALHICRQNVH